MSMTKSKSPVREIFLAALGGLSFVILMTSTAFSQEAAPTVRANIDETAGLSSRRSSAQGPTPLAPIPEGFEKVRLTAGFLLQIDIYNVPEMSGQLRVDEKGDVTVPLVGAVHVAGETVPEAQHMIAKALSDQEILKDPQVTLNILQFSSKSVSVLGEVQAPGRVQALLPVSLGNLLAQVGGETIAAGNDIEIQHPDERGAVTTRLVQYVQGKSPAILQSTFVDPGDTVLVHRAGIVYVLGAVNRPGGYLMVNGGTLSAVQAISLAGGTTLQASNRWAVIVRHQGDGFIQLKVPLGKMQSGAATPIQLEWNDALFVPTSGWKVALINGSSILSSTAAAAVYRAP